MSIIFQVTFKDSVCYKGFEPKIDTHENELTTNVSVQKLRICIIENFVNFPLMTSLYLLKVLYNTDSIYQRIHPLKVRNNVFKEVLKKKSKMENQKLTKRLKEKDVFI